MQCVCGSAGWLPPAPGSQPSRPHFNFFYNKKRTVFNKRVRPLSAFVTLKTPLDGANAEPLANSARELAKFCPHQNFAKRKPIFQWADLFNPTTDYGQRK